MPHAAPLPRPRAALLVAPLLLLVQAGCIVLPRTAEVYDPKCRTFVKQIVLETEVVGAIGACRNDGCAVMLASMGIVSAASAVISGSVAIIGNVVYWAERQGRCPEPAAGYAPTPAVVPAASAAPGVPLPRPPVVPGIVPLPKGSA
jgi:hypothetical protein